MTDYAAELQRQRCKACWSADGFNFSVPDTIWEAVVPPALRHHVVCLACFDRFAAERGIYYAPHLGPIYFAGEQTALELVPTTKPLPPGQ